MNNSWHVSSYIKSSQFISMCSQGLHHDFHHIQIIELKTKMFICVNIQRSKKKENNILKNALTLHICKNMYNITFKFVYKTL